MSVSRGMPQGDGAVDVEEQARSDLRAAIEGQVAVVTGGAAGIGAAICQRLSGLGATVIVGDLDAERGLATAASTARPDATFARVVDVSDPDQVLGLINGVISEFGRIDLLVNNAGVAPVVPLELASYESWRQTFAVNVEGPMVAMQRAALTMLEQSPHAATECRGKIVNISSPAADHGRPFLSAYGASKAALNHLSKSAAVRWGDLGIATTIVYPGTVQGAMWPGLGDELAALEGRTTAAVIKERVAFSPTGKLQDPTEVAAAVSFVAGFRGCGLNGQIVWSEAHVSPA